MIVKGFLTTGYNFFSQFFSGGVGHTLMHRPVLLSYTVLELVELLVKLGFRPGQHIDENSDTVTDREAD